MIQARRLVLSPNSRYVKTPLYTTEARDINGGVGNVSFYGTFVPPKVEVSDQDAFITIQDKDNGRLDYLAYIHYGTPELWWVIAMANDIMDPIYGVEAGTMIRIPRNPTMFAALGVV